MPSALAFPDQGPLELGEGPHHRKHQVRHGGILPGEDQLFLDEFNPHTLPRQALDQGPQVIEVPGEPVHAVHDQGVPVPEEAQQLLQLRALRVLARGLVREGPVQLDALELADRVLVQTADPDVSNALPGHDAFLTKSVRLKSKVPAHECQGNRKTTLS
jgi:hypothetical protein